MAPSVKSLAMLGKAAGPAEAKRPVFTKEARGRQRYENDWRSLGERGKQAFSRVYPEVWGKSPSLCRKEFSARLPNLSGAVYIDAHVLASGLRLTRSAPHIGTAIPRTDELGYLPAVVGSQDG